MKSLVRLTVRDAVSALRAGQVVAIPTETVYGLGANALDDEAVRRIFAIKGRPADHPLIVHFAAWEHAAGWVQPTVWAHRLAEVFWPGPLTLILERGPLARDVVTGGLATIGVRVPHHPLTLELLRLLGSGVAAPSANRFGKVSPTRAEHVLQDLADTPTSLQLAGVLDGGPSDIGIESTIVDVSGDCVRLLRLGAISAEAIAEALNLPVSEIIIELHGQHGRARAPGQLASHYAPQGRVELLASFEMAARESSLKAEGKSVVRLDTLLPHEAKGWAKGLYEALREADRLQADVILVPHPPEGAMADAVLDRLERAAAPRT